MLRMAPLLGKEGCVSRIRGLQGTLQRGSVTRVPHLLILYHIFNPDRKEASDFILLPASTSEGKFKDLRIHLSSSPFLLSSTDYHHFKERLLNHSPSSSPLYCMLLPERCRTSWSMIKQPCRKIKEFWAFFLISSLLEGKLMPPPLLFYSTIRLD